MEVLVRKFDKKDIRDAILIWNQLVEDGVAFPQTELLDESSGMRFFEEQTFTGIACEAGSDKIVGLYILHPNNVGRCGHLYSNASYA